jgi:energy-coupling factor transporter ATP-binding protein EcfA2
MASVADLIVVTGPPGAGKSTVASVLSGLFDPSALVSGDEFFAFIDRGFVAPWTTAAYRQNEVVIGAAAAAAGRLVAGGYTVVYDGVIGPWFLETFGAATGLSSLHYAILLPPEQLCLDRVRGRADHAFRDLEAARHMYQQFADAEVGRRHVVDSTEDPTALASRLAQLMQHGLLRRSIGGQQA